MPHLHDDTAGVDFTLEEWADVFVDESKGLSTDLVVDYIKSDPVSYDGIMSGSLTHSLNPDPWNPMTDDEACAEFAERRRSTPQRPMRKRLATKWSPVTTQESPPIT